MECGENRLKKVGRRSRAEASWEEGRGPTQLVRAHSQRMRSTPSSQVRGEGITETLSLASTYLPLERDEGSWVVGVPEALSSRSGGKLGDSQTDTETDTKTDRKTRRDSCARRPPRVFWAAPL